MLKKIIVKVYPSDIKMNSLFVWGALITLVIVIIIYMVYYGYHLYKWYKTEPTNKTFDTLMTITASILVVVAFLMLVAAALTGSKTVMRLVKS